METTKYQPHLHIKQPVLQTRDQNGDVKVQKDRVKLLSDFTIYTLSTLCLGIVIGMTWAIYTINRPAKVHFVDTKSEKVNLGLVMPYKIK